MSDGAKEDAMREIFTIIDTDQSGNVTLKQLQDMLEKIRLTHKKYSGDALHVPDSSQDDKLNFEEFQSNALHLIERLGLTQDEALIKVKGGRLPEEERVLQQLFEVVDIDGGGSITKDELREMSNVVNPGLNDQDILRLMLTADTDRGGDIDYDEFCTFVHNARFDIDLNDAIAKLQRAFEEARARLEQSKRAFEEQVLPAPAAKLTPAEAARLKREKRKKATQSELTGEKLFSEEATFRSAIIAEEDESWGMLSSGAGAAFDEYLTAEKIERDRDHERRLREYIGGGGDKQRNDYSKAREKRRLEKLQHSKEKSSEMRYQLEDRVASQQNQMLCFGQQFKVLRQYLNKGTEYVRLEADREFTDLQKTIPKRNEEITSSLNRVDSMLVTVGRALMQESMVLHADGHKDVLKSFEGNPDFTWLSTGQGADQPKQRTQNSRITATHVNFSDTSNLHGSVEPSSMTMTMQELKKYLWATYRHYQSTGEGLTFLDFQKLVADVKVQVAGSISVLWANALKKKEDSEVLGLRSLDDAFYQGHSQALGNDDVSAPDRIDFHQFANLVLLLACERYIASPSSTPQYKLQCFLMNEILPLLPHESLTHLTTDIVESPLLMLNNSKLPTIPLLLEEHLDVLLPVANKIKKDIMAYIEGRQYSWKAIETENTFLERSVTGAVEFLASMDVMVVRHEMRLPKVPLSSGARSAVRALQGDKGHPVLPLKDVTNYLVYRAAVVGRSALREVVSRGIRELLASTYPALPTPDLNLDTSQEAVPFPMFLALCARVATYTSVAATFPSPPPPPKGLSTNSIPVYNFIQLLTHANHYVLTL